MGQGVGGCILEIGCWSMDIGGWRRWQGRWFVSHQFTSAFSFSFSVFMFRVSGFMFQISDFKNTSGMNSVGSLSKMFDRTTGYIK
jgi:hypothetical protein